MQGTFYGLLIDLIVVEIMTTFMAKTSATKIMSYIFAFLKSIKLPPNHLYLLCLYEENEARTERLARLEMEADKNTKVKKNAVVPILGKKGGIDKQGKKSKTSR